jgi:hypothetical protein
MNTLYPTRILAVCIALLGGLLATAVASGEETLPDSPVLMRALGDEITRSTSLQMEDLEKPYFIQFTVDDSLIYQITANNGDITTSERRRSRRLFARVRVGSYELDNTNFTGDEGGFQMFFGGGGEGGQARLPLDDDYPALRQAVWWATDQNYKDAVETLTKKRAYLKDKNVKDRPNDFSKASVVESIEPTAKLDFDRSAWEERLKRASAQFNKHAQIQEGRISLLAGAGNTYVVNTEGTRLRWPDSGAILIVTAELQADDGMKLSDSLTYTAAAPPELPPIEKVIADIDQMVDRLTNLAKAPLLDRYSGPVLFDALAAAQVFRTMFAEAVAGRADPVGTQRRLITGAGSLEKNLGERILPESFQIFDDPTVRQVQGAHLFGNYAFDDEGVRPERVDLVVDGTLQTMVMSRVPTKKLSASNGHARRAPGQGEMPAAVGNLFLQSKEGVADEKLKAQLIAAAKEDGLEYALRVAGLRTAGIEMSRASLITMIMNMQRSGREQSLGDPIYAYKVYVSDGHEELVRGLEFGPIKLRDLKRIQAAGNTPTVYNYVGLGFGGATPMTSIVAPALLFKELELSKIEQENEKPPILKTPLAR